MLNQLEPRKRNEYTSLLSERRALDEESTRLEKELASVSEARDKAKAEIDQDNTRARYHAISRQINELNAKKGKSSELLKSLQLSPEEQKRRAHGRREAQQPHLAPRLLRPPPPPPPPGLSSSLSLAWLSRALSPLPLHPPVQHAGRTSTRSERTTRTSPA